MEKNNKLENVVIEGKVTEVCEMEACWLTIKNRQQKPVFCQNKIPRF